MQWNAVLGIQQYCSQVNVLQWASDVLVEQYFFDRDLAARNVLISEDNVAKVNGLILLSTSLLPLLKHCSRFNKL